MSATRVLAAYLSRLRYEDLPPEVVSKAEFAVLDVLGNMIGGYPLHLSRTFIDIAKSVGGGNPEATILGDGARVSVPLAAFANGALSTMLDYSDSYYSRSGMRTAWAGALAVPAALAVAEARDLTGGDFLTSVVAGYECLARVSRSMDATWDEVDEIYGASHSVFAAVGAAGRAFELNEDEMLSAIGMAGIYTPVSAGYKWLGDEGLTPRKDIKQGWAWMIMTGAFTAQSARAGLQMLQANNILDGEKGLWRMLGANSHDETALIDGLGDRFSILDFRTKRYPGCAVTHPAIVAATNIARREAIDPDEIERVDVTTNRWEAIGFGEQQPQRLCDMEFSIPYQVSAAILGGDRGPQWYVDDLARDPRMLRLAARVFVDFDDVSELYRRQELGRRCAVTITTASGARFAEAVDRVEPIVEPREIREKFHRTVHQVLDGEAAGRVEDLVLRLRSLQTLSPLVDSLRALPSTTRSQEPPDRVAAGAEA